MYVDMQGLVDHCWCDRVVLLVLVLSDELPIHTIGVICEVNDRFAN